jgi:hypothetical protein
VTVAGFLMRLSQRVLAPQTLPRAAARSGAGVVAERSRGIEEIDLQVPAADQARAPVTPGGVRNALNAPRVSERLPPRADSQKASPQTEAALPEQSGDEGTVRALRAPADSMEEASIQVETSRGHRDTRAPAAQPTRAISGLVQEVMSEPAPIADDQKVVPAERPARNARAPRQSQSEARAAITERNDVEPAPIVHVSIGRIEVKQPQPAAPMPARPQSSVQRVSLDDYLRGTRRG